MDNQLYNYSPIISRPKLAWPNGAQVALQKDAPQHRAVQRNGTIIAVTVLSGLHHRYARG
jgi:hypothetical protein